MRGFILGLMLMPLLVACGTPSNLKPPVPLPELDATLNVRKVWQRVVDFDTAGRHVHLRPYLEGGVLFVANARGKVYAFRADTGRRLWSASTGLDLIGGVNGGEGLIVAGSRTGEVVALRQDNGQEVWRQRLSSEVLTLSPIALGTVVARTNDGKLHALSGASGGLIWQAGRTTPALSLRGASAPLINGGLLVEGFDTGKVLALALEGGRVAWEATVATPSGRTELDRLVDVDGYVAIDRGEVFAASYQGRLAALGLADGRVHWARDMSSYAGLVVGGPNLYITGADGAVWCLDKENGSVLWMQDKLLRRGLTAPAVLDDYVLVGDYEGYVHWLSRHDGRLLSRVPMGISGVLAAPMADGERAYVVGREGYLAALKPMGSVQAGRGPWLDSKGKWP